MKIQKIILLILGIVLVACTPRVDDLFDETAVVRLEHRRAALMEQFMKAENGWVMQYFARVNPVASDTAQHKGYTFIMKFREDGTVTVGAKVGGQYKTETSMWDVINDNSNVLTFNTHNSIFHYYSSPDPEMELGGADGEGIGGDYEFMVLEYNEQENYQLLKGKKQGCYIRMYPMAAGQDWEDYFAQIHAMDEFLFEEANTLDLFQDEQHWTLYNARTHEFRAFDYDADTLGGGSYFGFITTPKGIYINGDKFDSAHNMPREYFLLSADKSRLVSTTSPDIYITIDPLDVLVSASSVWRFAIGINTTFDAAEAVVNQNISAVAPNSYIASYGWKKAADGRYELYVYYSLRGKAATNYDIYYFTAEEGRHSVKLTYSEPHATRKNLVNYGSLDLVSLFNGTYDLALTTPWRPSKGLTATRQIDPIVLHLAH